MTKRPGTSRPALEIWLVLGAIVFVGNFLLVSDFGVYEDDYIFVTQGFLWSWRDARGQILSALREWPQGRPVGFALTYFLSYLGGRFDSLTPGYLVGYAIHLTNAGLFFALASRFVARPAALVAAAVLALYPVDGAKQLLQVRVFNGLNLTFLLTALLAWTRGRRLAAYAAATLCLLTYENLFFPFAVAPLLVRSWGEVRWRRVGTHLAACLAIPAALLLVRRQLGDARVAETLGSLGEVLRRIAVACAVGPFTAVRGLVRRTWDGLWGASGTGALAGALVAIALVLLLDAMIRAEPDAAEDGRDARGRIGPVAVAGLLGLLAGYVLAFRDDYYPPVTDIGRLSGFNVAGATGACLLLAAGCAAALDPASRLRRRAWVALSALGVAGLVSFGIEVQRRDYVESWRQQREVWTAALATSGEWTATTPVVVDLDRGDPMTRSTPGFNQAWMMSYAPYAARQLVELPERWRARQEGGSWTPAVYGFSRTLPNEAAPGGGVRVAVHPWLGGPGSWPVLRDGEFILLRYAGERLERSAEPLDTGLGLVAPRPPPARPPPALRPTRLLRVLTEPLPYWPSLRRARNYPR